MLRIFDKLTNYTMKTIDFFIERTAHVIVCVKHLSGFDIATLLSDTVGPGSHSVPLTDPVRAYGGKIALKYELVIDGQMKEWNLFFPA